MSVGPMGSVKGAKDAQETLPLNSLNKQNLGKEDFLKLLVAQLSHQDPLKPQEGSEFVAELAQFSNLEQAISTNTKLSELTNLSSINKDSQAMTLVGKSVTYDTSTVKVDALAASPIQFTLASAAAATKADIVSAAGKVVRTVVLGALGAGAQSVAFDGIGNDGSHLPAGPYTVRVKAADENGRTVNADTSHTAKVDAVVRSNGVTSLEVGANKVSLADVTRVQ